MTMEKPGRHSLDQVTNQSEHHHCKTNGNHLTGCHETSISLCDTPAEGAGPRFNHENISDKSNLRAILQKSSCVKVMKVKVEDCSKPKETKENCQLDLTLDTDQILLQ